MRTVKQGGNCMSEGIKAVDDRLSLLDKVSFEVSCSA